MDHQRSGEAAEQTATLLRLSMQLRDAAADADRQDVITKVDELLSLIAGEKFLPAPDPRRPALGWPKMFNAF